MPRIGRVVIPDYPHHVVQRGHNRQVIFTEPTDYEYYLATLAEFKVQYDVKVFGFCLMANHVHLILQPSEKVQGLGPLMKRLAGRQTRHVNRQERRSGTLWESRYKSSPIQTNSYLLACCRYVELNPVRARVTGRPDKYYWSSYRQHTGQTNKYAWLDHSSCFLALGPTLAESRKRYKEFVTSKIPQGEWELIRETVQRGQLTGNSEFVNEVEAIIGRRIEHRKRGRPRKIEEK